MKFCARPARFSLRRSSTAVQTKPRRDVRVHRCPCRGPRCCADLPCAGDRTVGLLSLSLVAGRRHLLVRSGAARCDDAGGDPARLSAASQGVRGAQDLESGAALGHRRGTQRGGALYARGESARRSAWTRGDHHVSRYGRAVLRIASSGSSRPSGRMNCGSRTSHTSRPSVASSTRRSSLTCSRGASSAGGHTRRCGPISCSMHSNKHCMTVSSMVNFCAL
jgi:hypothetical protein